MDAPRLRLVTAALVVSIAAVVSLVTSAVVASRAYVMRGEQQVRTSRTLDVTGSARHRVTSDLALWWIRVAGEGKSLEEAYAKQDAAAAKVRKFLSDAGFPAEAVVLTPIHTETHHRRDEKGNETREVAAYTLGRTFRISTADVARVSKAAGEVTALLQGGAHVESLAPEYHYSRLADLKVEMLGKAAANARERAEKIAEASRCRVGAVKDAKAGVLQITAPWSTEVSAGGVYNTSSIEKDVTSVVHLTLQIEAP